MLLFLFIRVSHESVCSCVSGLVISLHALQYVSSCFQVLLILTLSHLFYIGTRFVDLKLKVVNRFEHDSLPFGEICALYARKICFSSSYFPNTEIPRFLTLCFTICSKSVVLFVQLTYFHLKIYFNKIFKNLGCPVIFIWLCHLFFKKTYELVSFVYFVSICVLSIVFFLSLL